MPIIPSCLHLNQLTLEDETHFLLACPLYEKLRLPLKNSLPAKAVNCPTDEELFYIMNSEGKTIQELGIFCEVAFKARSRSTGPI